MKFTWDCFGNIEKSKQSETDTPHVELKNDVLQPQSPSLQKFHCNSVSYTNNFLDKNELAFKFTSLSCITSRIKNIIFITTAM